MRPPLSVCPDLVELLLEFGEFATHPSAGQEEAAEQPLSGCLASTVLAAGETRVCEPRHCERQQGCAERCYQRAVHTATLGAGCRRWATEVAVRWGWRGLCWLHLLRSCPDR